MLLHF